jgi:hypothetical protein
VNCSKTNLRFRYDRFVGVDSTMLCSVGEPAEGSLPSLRGRWPLNLQPFVDNTMLLWWARSENGPPEVFITFGPCPPVATTNSFYLCRLSLKTNI